MPSSHPLLDTANSLIEELFTTDRAKEYHLKLAKINREWDKKAGNDVELTQFVKGLQMQLTAATRERGIKIIKSLSSYQPEDSKNDFRTAMAACLDGTAKMAGLNGLKTLVESLNEQLTEARKESASNWDPRFLSATTSSSVAVDSVEMSLTTPQRNLSITN